MNISNDLAIDYLPSVNIVWISFTTYLVFFMEIGFGFLEAGSVRFKNQ